MERCDFSSVITIISDHISESKRGNQSDLMYALFDTFATDEINTDETFDEGAVCYFKNRHIILYKLDNFLIWNIIVIFVHKALTFFDKTKNEPHG